MRDRARVVGGEQAARDSDVTAFFYEGRLIEFGRTVDIFTRPKHKDTEDYVTGQPERYLAAELVREKVLLATRQEVPHSVAVSVDKWEETPAITRIFATIRVEREGQKGIVIGGGGAMLKRIGTLARQEMERLFGVKVFLDLHVKVEPGWREKSAFLDALDWRTMASKDDA